MDVIQRVNMRAPVEGAIVFKSAGYVIPNVLLIEGYLSLSYRLGCQFQIDY